MPHRPRSDPLRVSVAPAWRIGRGDAAPLDANTLLDLLAAVQGAGSIAQAGREVGLSYRHAWGLLQQAEQYAITRQFNCLALVAVQNSTSYWQQQGFAAVAETTAEQQQLLTSYTGQHAQYLQKFLPG